MRFGSWVLPGKDKGNRVVVQNRFGCGVCKQCITGNYEKCVDELGYGVFVSCAKPPHLWGAYSEYLYLPPRAMIHKISEDVPLEELLPQAYMARIQQVLILIKLYLNRYVFLGRTHRAIVRMKQL